MASLEKRGDCYRIVFRFGGRKFQHPLKTRDGEEAQESLSLLEGTLGLLERGAIDLPTGADLPIFLMSRGKQSKKAELAPELTLEALAKEFQQNITSGSMEPSTLGTIAVHLGHLKHILGARFRMRELGTKNLQGYVDARAREYGRREKHVSATTIKKEIVSFRGLWKWAVNRGLLTGEFPGNGLVFPKTDEKPPFRTWAEIERQIARGRMTEAEQAESWDSLFLTLAEIEQLLEFIRTTTPYPFLYPMAVFAAHTGARRSELIRSRITDFDFTAESVTIHEKKRRRGLRTSRRVPISPMLAEVMECWFSHHPGGPYALCLDLHLPHGRKTRTEYGALTRNEAHHHLQRVLAGSKWEKIRGWHIFRHSFCSNCAARGIDQRLINAWVGHTTEEMVRRYRHLIPDQQRTAIRMVFTNGQQPQLPIQTTGSEMPGPCARSSSGSP